MFLSKNPNGFFYLFYFDEFGKRHKVSTKCKYKSDALAFLQDFKQKEQEHKIRLQRKSLSQFTEDFLTYSKSVHTPKTQKSIKTAFREFIRIVGDIRLDKVGIREIEGFLAQKKVEASDWTARKYCIALASAFETAKRMGLHCKQSFSVSGKAKGERTSACFFHKA